MRATDQIISFSIKPDELQETIQVPKKVLSATEWPASWWDDRGKVVKEIVGRDHRDVECLVVDHGGTGWGLPTERGNETPISGLPIRAIIQPARQFRNVTKVKRDGVTWPAGQWEADYNRNCIYIMLSCPGPYDRKWTCDLDGIVCSWDESRSCHLPGDVFRELLTGPYFGKRPSSDLHTTSFDKLNTIVPLEMRFVLDSKQSLSQALIQSWVSTNCIFRREIDGLVHAVSLWEETPDSNTVFLDEQDLSGWTEWYDYSAMSDAMKFEWVAYDQSGDEPDVETTVYKEQTLYSFNLLERMKTTNQQTIRLWTRYWGVPGDPSWAGNDVAYFYWLRSGVKPVHLASFRTQRRKLETYTGSLLVINRRLEPPYGGAKTFGGVNVGAQHENALWRVLTAQDRKPGPSGLSIVAKKIKDLEPWEVPANG